MKKMIKASKGFGLLGVGADLLERSEGARSFAKNLGILPAAAAKYYDKNLNQMLQLESRQRKLKKVK